MRTKKSAGFSREDRALASPYEPTAADHLAQPAGAGGDPMTVNLARESVLVTAPLAAGRPPVAGSVTVLADPGPALGVHRDIWLVRNSPSTLNRLRYSAADRSLARQTGSR
jgi:hypothetical protein